jgi:hypothetical protein
MKNSEKYAALVAQAEKAVASVKDPSLKQIAFQKVLDDLLSARETDREPLSQEVRPRRVKLSKIRGSARGGPTQYIQELIGDNFFKKPKLLPKLKLSLATEGIISQ